MANLREMPARQRLSKLRDWLMKPKQFSLQSFECEAYAEAIDIIEQSLSSAPPTWKPLRPCVTPTPDYTDEQIATMARMFAMTIEATRAAIADAMRGEWFQNDVYQVIRRVGDDDGQLKFHLSVKRLDQQPVRSWRDMQQIKNELIGREIEAIELFPAESRLVNTANQYHLFGYPTKGWRFPFGFNERVVHDDTGGIDGAVQQRRA